MKSKSKSKPAVDPYLEGLIAKLVDRLINLEKKIDTVVAQTASRPSGNGQQHPKPFQVPVQVQPPPHRDRTMYEAICADCSKVCEVPFRPSEDRAVYCKACFAARKTLPAGRQAAGKGPGMPILRPVALPPKPVGKLHMPIQAPSTPKKSKKIKPSKKAKKKK